VFIYLFIYFISPQRISGKENLFEIVTPSRTFYMQVDSKEDMDDWVRIFNDLLEVLKPTLQRYGGQVRRHGPVHAWMPHACGRNGSFRREVTRFAQHNFHVSTLCHVFDDHSVLNFALSQ